MRRGDCYLSIKVAEKFIYRHQTNLFYYGYLELNFFVLSYYSTKVVRTCAVYSIGSGHAALAKHLA